MSVPIGIFIIIGDIIHFLVELFEAVHYAIIVPDDFMTITVKVNRKSHNS